MPRRGLLAPALVAAAAVVFLSAGAGSAALNQASPLPGSSADAVKPPRQQNEAAGPGIASHDAGPTTPSLDNFNRGDGPLCDSAWACGDPLGGPYVLSVYSNQVGAGFFENRVSYRHQTYSGDVEIYATIPVKPPTDGAVGLAFNLRDVNCGCWDAYWLTWDVLAGTDILRVEKLVDNAFQYNVVSTGLEMGAGDRFLARRIGDQFQGWVDQGAGWQKVLQGTDTTSPLPGGGSFGLFARSVEGRFDDLGGGAYAHEPPPLDQSTGTCGIGVHAYSRSACRQGVNTLTGRFTTRVVDLALPGVGVPFALTRTYTSSVGWTHNYATVLLFEPPPATKAGARTLQDEDVVLRGDEGQRVLFTPQTDPAPYIGPPSARSTLTHVAGTYRLLTHDQILYLFDTEGRLVSVKDRNGQGLTLAYSGLDPNVQAITDSAGRLITFVYEAERLKTVTLPDQRFVEYGYYPNGLLQTVTDARGETTTYDYDLDGRLKEIVDQRGKKIVQNVIYDPASERVTSQQDADGKTTTFDWVDATQTATMTDARLKTWTDVYEENLVKERRNHLGESTRFEYWPDLSVKTMTDPRNKVTAMEYDARGNLTKRTPPPPLPDVEEWTYTLKNDPLTYKDGKQKVTNYDYDTAGNLTQVLEPDADGLGQPERPEWVYDPEPGTGLVRSVTDPLDKTTYFEYDDDGNLEEVRTPLGHRTTMTYDDSGRMETMVDPRGNAAGGTPADYTWLYEYHADDQLKKVTNPLGEATQYELDDAGNLLTVTDAKAHVTSYDYDDPGRLETVTAPDPDGPGEPLLAPVISYEYDDVGNLEIVTAPDPDGPGGPLLAPVSSYGYDDANRLNRRTLPGARVWTYGYDESGNLDEQVDAKGNETAGNPDDGKTTYGYDELNRQTSITYSDATPDVTFLYDENSNRTRMTEVGSTPENYTYDFLNRLAKVSRGADDFTYAYDLLNLTGRTYPGGASTSYTYWDDQRLRFATSGGLQTEHAYFENGALKTTTLPAANGHVETREYDEAGRLILVDHRKQASILSRFAIDLDPVGNPESVVRTGTSLTQTQTYGYDNLDRLTAVCFQQAACPTGSPLRIAWTYDALGNRKTETSGSTQTTYNYTDGDVLQSVGSTSYTFDKNGNQLTAGSSVFTYDLANRLKTTTLGGTTTTYAYDGLGKRVEAAQGGTPPAPTLKTPCPTAIGNSGSASVAKPTGTQAGDLLVVGLAFDKGTGVAITPPSGWTLIRRTDQSNKVGYATYRKAAGGSEPASYAFALTNAPKWSIGACAIAGANTAAAIDVHNGASGNSGNPSAPSLTTTGPSRLVLAFYANEKPATYSNYTAPAQERWDAPNVAGGLPSNALASYTQPSAGATGAKSATATQQGRWVAQQIAITPSPNITRFLWDVNQGLPQLALERDANNSLIRSYVYGAGRISLTAGSTTSYFHHDGLRSVSNLTSSTGATQRTLSYEPFGSIRTDTTPGAASFLKFAGEYEDPTGLYHLRARQYDPKTGRFLSRDPVPSVGSAYAYAANNPTSFVDPSGAWPSPFNFIVCRFCGSDAADIHTTLDAFGLVPIFGEPADAINAIWYLAEGDRTNAALSGGAILPGAGWAAVATKWGRHAAKGGTAVARSGLAAERSVSGSIGVARNAGAGRATIPGSGPGGYRVPDFDPALTISQRGTVVEVKNVTRLSSSAQLRDLQAYANSRGVPLEIFTNAQRPQTGQLADAISAGLVRLTPIP